MLRTNPFIRFLSVLAVCVCAPHAVVADDQIFEITELAISGRIVAAEFADFDGDGVDDLMIATLDGIPPREERLLNIYLRQAGAEFGPVADHVIPIPELSAVFDIADLKDTPGDELVLLRPDRVTILSVASKDTVQWNLPVDGPSTVGAGNDERGFDRFRLVYTQFSDEPWLLLPQIGQVSAMTVDGDVLAEMKVGRRTNYFVTKDSGLVSVETDIQIYFDAPKISIGDVDGDGQADVVASTRHEIRVFLRDPDGGLSDDPSYSLPLQLIDKQDHARGSGAVVTVFRDLDDDGLLDLMITHSAGNFTKTETTTYVYHNQDGRWQLGEPDDRFESQGAVTSDLLLDIDGDGTLELVRVQIKFSILEIVEFLLTREIDVMVFVHRLEDDGSYDMKPWSKKKISTQVSFDTFRPKGFMPTGGVDLNADGRLDFVSSGGGKGIEVYLGSADGLFSKRRAYQALPTTGVIRFEDYDDDSLPDFLLWDSQSFDSELRIGRNLGALIEASER